MMGLESWSGKMVRMFMMESLEDMLRNLKRCSYCRSTEDVVVIDMDEKDKNGNQCCYHIMPLCRDCRKELLRKLEDSLKEEKGK